MSAGEASGPDELKALRKENKRMERRVRQLERLVRTSEMMARQSKSVMERSLDGLRERTTDLEAAKEAAEAGLAAKDRFLATMSHEIRTPMNGVIGCIDLLTLSDLEQEDRSLVMTLKDSAETMMTLLNDILDFAKLQEDQTVIESRRLDVAHLVASVASSEKARCSSKGIDVLFAVDPAVPQALLGDEHRLRQVLSNLMGNAVKFTEHGSITLSVAVTDGGQQLRFEVRDTGIGMKPEVLGSIFAAFTQADETTARRFGGTGLGLAISSALVRAMGGQIEVSSEVGVGSCFYFSIPLALPAPDSREEESKVPAKQSLAEIISAQDVAGLRVLLVDDNPVNRKVGAKLIERLGCTVGLATGGAEGAQRALEEDWDAVLMDCSMPDVDGFQATERIRRSNSPRSRVHIVALTALSMEGDRERCLAAGMNDYVQKPLRVAELQEALARASSAERDAA
ncbi:Autoinducer 2 sensor kinase/phosphatase LuxQ [Planctomycetes bacterium Poly30]|uniref:histidine kinase n=1 Tax=Saltatorellus ferox TaxID=2528018 RepID=A0A518EQZ2_9BACT|nr:Autoinducer 2 sensor kinase/phosphatase LuxQ [Planctomycetes bacterium Poly30]